jgi:hypothetical protein
MIQTLVTGFVGGVCAWFITEFVAKPFRRFYDLRREVNRHLVRYGNVQARFEWINGNLQPTGISPAEDARLTEAQNALRNLGGEMRAFANVDFIANRWVGFLGYDADKIAGALIGYSNKISRSTISAGRR